MLYVYSKENCPQCLQLESLLKVKAKAYKVLKLEKDFTRESLEEKFAAVGEPMPRSFPILFDEDVPVGGLQEAKVAIVQGKL